MIFRTSPEMIEASDRLAARFGVSRSELARRAVAEFVNRELGHDVDATTKAATA